MANNQTKKWVFKLLVKDDKDFVGLVAYSLYKHRKNEIAEDHRSSGMLEAEISTKLQAFHDESTVGATAINQYRERGKAILEDIIAQAEERRDAIHQSTLAQLKKEHAKELSKCHKKAMDEIAAAASVTKNSKDHWLRKTALWLISGMPGAVSTVVLVVVIYGLMALFSSDEKRKEIAANGVNTVLGDKVVAPADAPGTAMQAPPKKKSNP